MKMTKKALAYFLSLCMVLGLLTACTSRSEITPAPTGTETAEPLIAETPEPAVETEDPEAEAEALLASYQDAAEALAAAENLVMTISVTEERTVGEDTLTEELSRTAQFCGLGGDGMTAYVSDLIVIGTTRAAYELIYADGLEYAKVKQARYYSAATASDFLAGQIPAVMLDAGKYAELSAEETAEGRVLRFDGAEEGEDWAIPKGAALLGASGMATLSADGALTAYGYELTYAFGGSVIHSAYSVELDTPETLELSAEIPENPKGYESLDSIDAAVTLLRACAALENASVVSSATSSVVYSEAAATLVAKSDEINYYDSGTDYIASESVSAYLVDYSTGESGQFGTEYSYADGTLSYTGSDGESESLPYAEEDMRGLYSRALMEQIPTYNDLVDASVLDLDEFYLIEFSATEEFGDTVKELASTLMFSDPSFLDGYATRYVTTKIDGYLAVEKYTWLPTALGLDFSGGAHHRWRAL